MVCKQRYGVGVRHLQLVFLGTCILVVAIINGSTSAAITLAREDKSDNNTVFEDDIKFAVRTWSPKEIINLEHVEYYTIFVFRFLGGILCCKLSNKLTLMAIMILFSCMTYTTPWFVLNYGYKGIMGIRIITGVFIGLFYPFVIQIAAKWIPFTETATCVGMLLGSVYFTKACISGLVIFNALSYGGWTSLYTLAANCGMIWSVVWFAFGADEPKKCFFISSIERYNIGVNTHNLEPLSWNMDIPWKKMSQCLTLYVASGTCFFTFWPRLVICRGILMREYIQNVYNPSQNTLFKHYTLIPAFIFPFFQLAVALLADFCNNKEIYPIRYQRKFCSALGFWGPCASLILLAYSVNLQVMMFFHITFILFQVFLNTGFALISFEIAPNYAGLVYGITTCFGYLPTAFVGPFFDAVVKDIKVEGEWDHFFLWAALSTFVGSYVYLCAPYSETVADFNFIPASKTREGRETSSLKSTSTL